MTSIPTQLSTEDHVAIPNYLRIVQPYKSIRLTSMRFCSKGTYVLMSLLETKNTFDVVVSACRLVYAYHVVADQVEWLRATCISTTKPVRYPFEKRLMTVDHSFRCRTQTKDKIPIFGSPIFSQAVVKNPHSTTTTCPLSTFFKTPHPLHLRRVS